MREFSLNLELRAIQYLVYLNYFNRPTSWFVYYVQVPGKLENASQKVLTGQVHYPCNPLR